MARKSKLPTRVMKMTRALAKELSKDVILPPPLIPEISKVRILPTMSKTDLLLRCQWPWGRLVPPEPVGEEALFGSAYHEAMSEIDLKTGKGMQSQGRFATIAKKWKVEAGAVAARVKLSIPLVHGWLGGDNPWGVNFLEWHEHLREVSYALDVRQGTARQCDGPRDEDHQYPDRQEGELPGTADLVLYGPREIDKSPLGKSPAQVIVLDYKTGYDPGSPSVSGQLKSLALAATRALGLPPGRRKAIAGYIHAHDPSTPPTILTETFTEDELAAHRVELARAFARIGDGSLTPGEWCVYCPAYMVCPVQRSSLVHMGAAGIMTREKVGEIYQALQHFGHLEGKLRERIREWIRANGPADTPSGLVLGFVKRPYSNLSQASIRRHLPVVKAEELIARGKREGWIEEGEREELRAVKE